MFNIRIFLDAAALSIFAMFALWAAGSKWHWFVRTAVAAGAVLFILLLPAYELVIQFGLQMLVVVAGVVFWRWRVARRWKPDRSATLIARPQISLQSLLLLTVVVAVATPVLVRTQHLNQYQWVYSITVGIQYGLLTLACAWLVLGNVRWQVRAALAIPLFLTCVFVLASISALTSATQWFSAYSANVPWRLPTAADILTSAKHWTVLLAIAVPMICTWLWLMVKAGWYDAASGNLAAAQPPLASSLPQRRARLALAAWTLAIMAFPVYLFVQLMRPLPAAKHFSEHAAGYPDIVAAGQLIGMADANALINRQQRAADELAAMIAAQSDAFERMRKAFTDPAPPQADYTPEENEAARYVVWALDAKLDLAERLQSPQMATEANVDWLHLLAILKGERSLGGFLYPEETERSIAKSVWELRETLSAEQLQTVLEAMQEYDTKVPNWSETLEALRSELANSGWKSHLQLILDDWNGTDRFKSLREFSELARAQFRLVLVELAIDAFEREHGRPPKDLAELVPKYLAAIPDDPYGSGPLRYRTNGDQYVVYSVGEDGDDDSAALDPAISRGDGDLTAEFLLRQ
jgi:hypothetical protein